MAKQKPKKGKLTKKNNESSAKYPRHDVVKALRIPGAILEQNAGKQCTDRESASFVGVGFNGSYRVEISSALKYGFLKRPKPGYIEITDNARRALRPQKTTDKLEAIRDAVLSAPGISKVYNHYRGENLPDKKFLYNALTDKFGIPAEKTEGFYEIFISSLNAAKLTEDTEDKKIRIRDVLRDIPVELEKKQLKNRDKDIQTKPEDNCFVVMPFASPVGDYYKAIYEPAIAKTGLSPIRADAEIFGTGKIMDQIWEGINNAKVLVAVLTGKNPNVFYELGLAHALNKPVVLVSSNEADVPFDLQHIRVIYYDVNDPFWGEKLIKKIAENIFSALKNPEEAIFTKILKKK